MPNFCNFDCIFRGISYSGFVYARVRLINNNILKQTNDVYLGNIPLMTSKGSFIINGAERVVVSQLQRSPGIYFNKLSSLHEEIYFAKIIPDRGL
jgi:DNA-directed RNA polymerase subunit beta